MEADVLAPLSFDDFKTALSADPKALDVHLDLVERNIEVEGCEVRIHCHCLKVDANGRVSTRRLAEFMRSVIVDYAIPRAIRQQAQERDLRENSTAATVGLYFRALQTFTDISTTGEGGELLLYILAERFLGLPQILCKMDLKTSGQMHYNGADGVYASVDDDGVLNLFWGESKIHADAAQAIRECLSSLRPFLVEEEHEEAKRERDLVLLSEKADLGDPNLNDALRRYFDVSDPAVTRKRYRAVALVGFDGAGYPAAGAKCSANGIIDASRTALRRWARNVNNRIVLEKLQECRIEFLCLPLPSADDFRTGVLEALGLAK
ncbi:DUF1837 domain-containing protein [Methylobacterium sp. J-001]|uniref:HamA C-terminal domain-containing protein n=1 Tax=Methylobacterium sp. J-001 TaxID=2836609 RepID=UPI001FB949E0|nr:DUF1837 domain-containing protein [Methylobacterium sp. J-001]MCJ2116625.1 DUF1837 domain-containing protein [Methylobacterium sp. J-001]